MSNALERVSRFVAGGRERTASVIGGDITKVSADCLITAINDFGDWDGGVDNALYRVAGTLFHDQARACMPLRQLDTVVAAGSGNMGKRFPFGDVVFVVDHPKGPVSSVVRVSLAAAGDAGYKHIALPAIRTGVMLGRVERNIRETMMGISQGVQEFFANVPNSSIEHITFVIYNDSAVMEELGSGLRRLLKA